MNNKIKKRSRIKPDAVFFDEGGMKLDGVVGTIGGAAGIAGTAINNLKVPEVKPWNVQANSIDDLMSKWSNARNADLGKTNVSGSALGGVSSGASAGMAFGPLGATIGGAIGGLTGGITAAIGNEKKKREETRLNREMVSSFSNTAQNLNAENMDMTLANMMADGGFTNGITFFNEGGTHEENPLMGVPQGIGLNNKPNLVEEGEVKYKDYIYSNRLTPSKKLLEEVGLHSKYEGKTFADIATILQKESEERPNDNISKNGLNDSMTKLQQAQEIIKLKKKQREENKMQLEMIKNPGMMQSPTQMANGGNLPQGVEPSMQQLLQQIAGWLQQGMSPQQIMRQLITAGIPAQQAQELVMQTQQEISQSQSQQPQQEFALGGNLYSERGNLLLRSNVNTGTPTTWSPNSSFDLNITTPSVQPITENVMFPMAKPGKVKTADDYLNFVSKGNYIPQTGNPKTFVDTSIPTSSEGESKEFNLGFGPEALRYAPVLGAGMMSLSDAFGLTNKPDYSTADAMKGMSVKGERINNYMAYNPFDREYYQNKLNANAGATRAGLANSSGGNRATYMAGLLGADYNYGENMGNLARQAEEYNLAQRQRVEEFNRGTNQFNAEQGNWEQGINTELATKSILARAEAKNLSNSAKAANLGNLLDNLGNVGREEMAFNMIKSDPSKYYEIGRDGKIKYKGNQKKNGGTLKKKGIEYGII